MKKMLQYFKYLFALFITFIFTNAFAIQTQWSNGIESQVRIISPFTHTNYQNEKIRRKWIIFGNINFE